MWAFVFLLRLWVLKLLGRYTEWRPSCVRSRRSEPQSSKHPHPRRRAKPPWVLPELLRLKALMPEAGCRRLADVFNRRFAHTDVSIGKTFVNDKLREHRLEVLRLRRTLRRRKPRASAPNRVWGLDLTGKTDRSGQCHSILGLVDHGTRANLALIALPDKAVVTLLRVLIGTIERYGKPRFIRTDNEGVFTSRRFRWALWLAGIRHQRTDQHCPWQNGRIERFFGTLKGKLDHFAVDSRADLNGALAQFRLWYNHIRPHQALTGRTPAEVWAGEAAMPRFRKAAWFEAWEGLLQGYYMRR